MRWFLVLSEMLILAMLISVVPKKNTPLFVGANLIAIALAADACYKLRLLEKNYLEVELREDLLSTLREAQAVGQLGHVESAVATKLEDDAADKQMLRQLQMLEATSPLLGEMFALTGKGGAIQRMALGLLQKGGSIGDVLLATADAEMQLENSRIAMETQIQSQQMAQKQQNYLPPVATTATNVDAATPTEVNNDITARLISAAKITGIETTCVRKDLAPSYQRLIFNVRTEDFASLPRWDKAAQLSLGKAEVFNYVFAPEQIAWEINLDPSERIYKPFPANRSWVQGGRELVLGWGIEGEIVISLANESTPQLLIVGTTGSGKSNFLRGCIYSLLMQGAKVNVCGGKLSDFEDFAERFPQEIKLEDLGDTPKVVGEYFAECDRRNKLTKQELNAQDSWILVLDEYKGSVPFDNAAKKLYDAQLSEVTRRGRGLKLHLIVGLQKGSLRNQEDPQGLPPDLRSNLPCRISFRVSEAKDGRLVLHRRGNAAVSLMGRGDAIVQSAEIDLRFQAYNFEEIP